MSIPISQFITPPPPLSPFGGHTWILHICVSIQSCKPVHLYHFSSFKFISAIKKQDDLTVNWTNERPL